MGVGDNGVCADTFRTYCVSWICRLTVLGPLVLAADLVFLLGREVILDVECLANLLWRLALDHVGDGLAADVEKSLDVHVVGREDDLKQHLLVHLHELLIPVINVRRLLARIGIVLLRGDWVVLVVLAPLENLAEDGLGDLPMMSASLLRQSVQSGIVAHIHDRNGFLARRTEILDHVLNEHAAFSNLALCASGQYEARAVAESAASTYGFESRHCLKRQA